MYDVRFGDLCYPAGGRSSVAETPGDALVGGEVEPLVGDGQELVVILDELLEMEVVQASVDVPSDTLVGGILQPAVVLGRNADELA